MRRALFLFLTLTGYLLAAQFGLPQAMQPAPTLVPPTLVPTPTPAGSDVLVSESAIARLQRDGRVKVGIFFNAPPFGVLDIRGQVSGFDADLARGLAKAWEVEVEFVQVTRQNALDTLLAGQADLLIASQVHRRELDSLVEFSHTYYTGSQSMMVRADDGAVGLADMAGRRVGVVIGTDGERTVSEWLAGTNPPMTLQTYLTLDRAYVALVGGEVDGVVDNRVRLTRVATQPELVRILDEPVAPEPYGIVILRQDVNMRNLVNRTLQYLAATGSMEEIHQANFPGVSFPVDTIPLWAGIGDEAPKPSQYPTEITYPAQYVVPRMLNSRVLRIAGTATLPEDAPESRRRLEALMRSLIEAMAQRWGMGIEHIPDSAANALELVANGSADIAVGVQPDWTWADRVDFTGPYLLHGERLMVRANSDIDSFVGLRGGKWVAVPDNEPDAARRAVELADSVNARIEIYQTREQDIAFSILNEHNADVAFGDSLKLIPHVQANSTEFKLTNRWYSRLYVAFGVPRNDLDFRLLVDYTLQELVKDGTLTTLLQPLMLPEDIPAFDVWPGPAEYLGLSLAG